MNPIKNKKDLETTVDEIRSWSFSYLEKYSASKQQLKTYLLKKMLKKSHKSSNINHLLDILLTSNRVSIILFSNIHLLIKYVQLSKYQL